MTPTKTVLLLAASGLALTLGGCKLDNRPLLARFTGARPPAPTAVAQPGLPDIGAPPAAATAYLPPPPPLPSANAYPYAERARVLDRIVDEAPPAYAFDYGGAEPWAWQAADDSLMFAEPYGDDYRFYYYEPGAPYPYFVRDPGHGYAFGPNGALLAMFDAAGALIAADRYNRYYPEARSYWSHGYDLQRAHDSGRRRPVDPGVWAARAPRLRGVEQRWIDAPRSQPAWRDWRASQGERFARADLAPPPVADRPGGDNGRHLGRERGHDGVRREPTQIASASPPPAQTPRGRVNHAGRGRAQEAGQAPGGFGQARGHGAGPRPATPMAARPGHPHGHGGGPQLVEARPPEAGPPRGGQHGRSNGGAPAPQVQARGGGEAHGHSGSPQFAQGPAGRSGHDGGHGTRSVAGQPAPQVQHQAQGGGQPQGHGGGGGHGGGEGGGHGGGQGKTGGKDHGHQH